jgi:hypothetical protein
VGAGDGEGVLQRLTRPPARCRTGLEQRAVIAGGDLRLVEELGGLPGTEQRVQPVGIAAE